MCLLSLPALQPNGKPVSPVWSVERKKKSLKQSHFSLVRGFPQCQAKLVAKIKRGEYVCRHDQAAAK